MLHKGRRNAHQDSAWGMGGKTTPGRMRYWFPRKGPVELPAFAPALRAPRRRSRHKDEQRGDSRQRRSLQGNKPNSTKPRRHKDHPGEASREPVQEGRGHRKPPTNESRAVTESQRGIHQTDRDDTEEPRRNGAAAMENIDPKGSSTAPNFKAKGQLSRTKSRTETS